VERVIASRRHDEERRPRGASGEHDERHELAGRRIERQKCRNRRGSGQRRNPEDVRERRQRESERTDDALGRRQQTHGHCRLAHRRHATPAHAKLDRSADGRRIAAVAASALPHEYVIDSE
jgi:hypothetical protein